MVNISILVASITSIISLALISAALGTNYWIRFDRTKEGTDSYDKVNALISDRNFTPFELQYSVDRFGLWVGCYRETLLSSGEVSCGFISSRCIANICWTVKYQDSTTKCQDHPVQPLEGKCSAFRTTRAFTILGTLFVVIGAALLLVSTCVTSSRLVWSATVFNAVAVIFTILAFVVFFLAVIRAEDLSSVTNMGVSFILLITTIPLVFIASVLAALGALSTPTKQYGNEDSE